MQEEAGDVMCGRRLMVVDDATMNFACQLLTAELSESRRVALRATKWGFGAKQYPQLELSGIVPGTSRLLSALYHLNYSPPHGLRPT